MTTKLTMNRSTRKRAAPRSFLNLDQFILSMFQLMDISMISTQTKRARKIKTTNFLTRSSVEMTIYETLLQMLPALGCKRNNLVVGNQVVAIAFIRHMTNNTDSRIVLQTVVILKVNSKE